MKCFHLFSVMSGLWVPISCWANPGAFTTSALINVLLSTINHTNRKERQTKQLKSNRSTQLLFNYTTLTSLLCPGYRPTPRPCPPTSTRWWRAARSSTRPWRSVKERSGPFPSCFHTDRTTARPAMWVQTVPSRGQRCPSCHCSCRNSVQSSEW